MASLEWIGKGEVLEEWLPEDRVSDFKVWKLIQQIIN